LDPRAQDRKVLVRVYEHTIQGLAGDVVVANVLERDPVAVMLFASG